MERYESKLNVRYNTYEIMDLTGDEFIGWDVSEQLRWRYGIAFSSYAICTQISIILLALE